MKKTFRLAAVLVALAALVMASCQNAAGGSGGGGGGVTPSPTPQPEGRTVEVEEIKLVGSYKIADYASLVLGSDGKGALSFNAPSASTRSILLNDYPIEWKIDYLDLGLVEKKSDTADFDTALPVKIPYLSLDFGEDVKGVTVEGTKFVYAQEVGEDASSQELKETSIEVKGLLLTLKKIGAADFTTANLVNLSTFDGSATAKIANLDSFGVSKTGTVISAFTADDIGYGIFGKITIDGVEFPVAKRDASGAITTAALVSEAPKAADLAGTWSPCVLNGEELTESDAEEKIKDALKEAYNTTNGYDFSDASEEYVKGGKPVFLPTLIDVKGDGGVADVVVMVYYAIKDDFKKDGFDFLIAGKTVTVTNVTKMAEGEDADDGYAMGVIEGCKVEVVKALNGFSLLKLAKEDTDGTTFVPLMNKTATDALFKANVPFASASKLCDAGTKKGKAAAADDDTILVTYRKGAVTN